MQVYLIKIPFHKTYTFLAILMLIVFTYAPDNAYACSITDLKSCVKDVVKEVVDPLIKGIDDDIGKVKGDISTLDADLKRDIGDVKGEISSLEGDITKDFDIVKKDVEKVESKVESIESSIGKDFSGVISDIKSDVTKIEQDTENLEKTVINDIKEDVSEIKNDIKEIEKVVASVERIEQKIVHFIENVAENFWDDLKRDLGYVLYGIIAVVIGYIVIRIIQFALWLHAYLRDDGVESNTKKIVTQNEQIIELLQKISKDK